MTGDRILTGAMMNSDNLQVWNNAAFDDDKENRQTPVIRLSPLAMNPAASKIVHFRSGDDDRSIEAEIEEVEREIKRLSKRLEDLKHKKADSDLKAALESSRRGRIVAARFMDDHLTKNRKMKKKGEENEACTEYRRRGMSLGPLEITPLRSATQSRRKSCILRNAIFEVDREEQEKRKEGSKWTAQSVGKTSCFLKNPVIEEEEEEEKGKKITTKTCSVAKMEVKANKVEMERPQSAPRRVGFRGRGASIGPLEIVSSARMRRMGGLPGIKEEERTGARSVSPPMLRKPASNVSDMTRKGVMTENKVRKANRVPLALQPRALFQEGDGEEKKKKKKGNNNKPMVGSSSSCKRAMKGRTVPSRYGVVTQTPTQSKRRKWSLPEKDDNRKESKEEEEEGVGVNSVEEGMSRTETKSPVAVGLLPRIQTCRWEVEDDGGRDSGPLKRVAELVGRGTYFGGLMDSSCSHEGGAVVSDD